MNLFPEYYSTHPETSYFTQLAVDAVLEGQAEKRSDESTSYSQFIISVCLHFYHWRSRNPEHGVGAMDTGQSFVQSLSVNENYRIWFMHQYNRQFYQSSSNSKKTTLYLVTIVTEKVFGVLFPLRRYQCATNRFYKVQFTKQIRESLRWWTDCTLVAYFYLDFLCIVVNAVVLLYG